MDSPYYVVRFWGTRLYIAQLYIGEWRVFNCVTVELKVNTRDQGVVERKIKFNVVYELIHLYFCRPVWSPKVLLEAEIREPCLNSQSLIYLK